MKRSQFRRLRDNTIRLESQPYDYVPSRRTPRLNGGFGWAFCQLGSTLNAATGSWPSITPTSVNGVTLYRPSTNTNGSQVLNSIQTNATIYNWRSVTWNASKTTIVLLQGNGTWSILDQDC